MRCTIRNSDDGLVSKIGNDGVFRGTWCYSIEIVKWLAKLNPSYYVVQTSVKWARLRERRGRWRACKLMPKATEPDRRQGDTGPKETNRVNWLVEVLIVREIDDFRQENFWAGALRRAQEMLALAALSGSSTVTRSHRTCRHGRSCRTTRVSRRIRPIPIYGKKGRIRFRLRLATWLCHDRWSSPVNPIKRIARFEVNKIVSHCSARHFSERERLWKGSFNSFKTLAKLFQNFWIKANQIFGSTTKTAN